MQFLQSILFLACATAFVEVLACSGDRPVAWCVSRFADKNGVTTGWTIDPKKAGSTCQQQQYASTTCCTSSFKPDRRKPAEECIYTAGRFRKFGIHPLGVPATQGSHDQFWRPRDRTEVSVIVATLT
ncbi:hypothetical protein PCANC_17487 [Puccinia coronata f. sp. avenae]|uniref:Hydrophobin n=2 Tax=Puccinia coronata f. sp. avenae TaxID=200324 RepID=A0A2N5SS79_9BASI|nr:hypothetical protein PCANC_17487 [Puccinia coronata f. sp. avenae]